MATKAKTPSKAKVSPERERQIRARSALQVLEDERDAITRNDAEYALRRVVRKAVRGSGLTLEEAKVAASEEIDSL